MMETDDWLILSSDIKYGRYYIPLSDYSLQTPYSRKIISSCLCKLDCWLYKVYLKAYNQVTRRNSEIKTIEKSTDIKVTSTLTGIPWVQIIDMIPYYSNDPIQLSQESFVEVVDLVNVLVEVLQDITLKLGGNMVYFPENSRFVISDKSRFSELVHEEYSLVLIDPPWPNKSVSRGKKYSCLDIYHLYDLKLDQILSDGSLIAIWVSNNPKIQSFIKEKYFKSLNITLLEEWYWIKVTESGELVVPFSQESHRKPFEILYIGQVNGEKDRVQRKVMFGVPSKHHSRKPFIHGNLYKFT